uniref:Uncharacterized protein n=1 Tax=mine drainage metagenome TaxID=410659 RepID=E6Q2S4_9ZZZZ
MKRRMRSRALSARSHRSAMVSILICGMQHWINFRRNFLKRASDNALTSSIEGFTPDREEPSGCSALAYPPVNETVFFTIAEKYHGAW